MKRVAVWAVLGLSPVAAGFARGQAATPIDRARVDQVMAAMAEGVRALEEQVRSDLGDTPRERYLVEDSAELAASLDEFRIAKLDRDPYELRREFSRVDATWHGLAADLVRLGAATPAVSEAARRVAAADAALHPALGLNEYPAGYHTAAQAPKGMADLKRLARALVDRAESLALAVRTDVAGAGAGRVIEDAVNLAGAADTFHDGLDLGGPVGPAVRNGFAGVEAISDRLEAQLDTPAVSPRVRSAWRNYRSAEVLIRRALGLPLEPSDVAGTALVTVPEGSASPVAAQADALAREAAALVQSVAPRARTLAGGAALLADAERLRAAADDFRQDSARPSLSPGQLAFEFREVDALWPRVARRLNRSARGPSGLDARLIDGVARAASEIHRLLGLPGHPPAAPARP